jgi:hypothetical protein
MNNKTKKWTILLCTAIMVTGLLSACGKNVNNAASPSASQAAASPTETSSPSASPESSNETKQGKGEFMGLADPHTVEIKTEGASFSYQLGEGTEDAVSGLNSGDAVSFEYTEITLEGDNTVTQLTLTKIQKDTIAGNIGGQGNVAKLPAGNLPAGELPATKEFTFNLEGNEEVRSAKLAQGNGYALYVFEQFSFDAKSNRLTMNVDTNYYVDIQKLPASYKLDDIKVDYEKELAKVGDVRSTKSVEINPLLGGGVSLFLVSSNDKLTREVIVKEVDGVGYLFRVNMPKDEPSEGFGPLAFASMSSIANQ